MENSKYRKNDKKNLNQFAVIGLGRFGGELTRVLIKAGKEVLAIDDNQERAQAIEGIATHTVTADTTDEKILKTLKIDSFDAVIVSIGDIQASILTVLNCKDLGVPLVIAKAKNQKHKTILEKMGADYAIIPEADMAHKVAGRLINRRLNDLMEVNDYYSIVEVDVPAIWANKSLLELDLRKKFNVNVILVLAGGDLVISSPQGETILSGNDRMIVGGENDCIARFTAFVSKAK